MSDFAAWVRLTKRDIELFITRNGRDWQVAIGLKDEGEIRTIIDALGKFLVGPDACPECYGYKISTLSYCGNCGRSLEGKSEYIIELEKSRKRNRISTGEI